jgi:hypothetical protein
MPAGKEEEEEEEEIPLVVGEVEQARGPEPHEP